MTTSDELSLAEWRQTRWYQLTFTLWCLAASRSPASESEQLRAILMRANPKRLREVQDMEKTMAEMWIAEGERYALSRVLQRLLSLRFDTLPEVVVQRIERCDDVEKLTVAIERTSQMQSLDELQL